MRAAWTSARDDGMRLKSRSPPSKSPAATLSAPRPEGASLVSRAATANEVLMHASKFLDKCPINVDICQGMKCLNLSVPSALDPRVVDLELLGGRAQCGVPDRSLIGGQRNPCDEQNLKFIAATEVCSRARND